MNESTFNTWLRSRLPAMSVRIENAVSAGLPDIAVFYAGRTYWIENKVGAFALLRPFQLATIARMYNAGGVRAFVFLLDNDMVRVYLPPFKTEFKSGHHKIVSEPVWVGSRAQLTPDEICGILQIVSMV